MKKANEEVLHRGFVGKMLQVESLLDEVKALTEELA
jgi:hypothetical protein